MTTFDHEIQKMVKTKLGITKLLVKADTRCHCITTIYNPPPQSIPAEAFDEKFHIRTEKDCYFDWEDLRPDVNAPIGVLANTFIPRFDNKGEVILSSWQNERFPGPWVEIYLGPGSKAIHPETGLAYSINRIRVCVSDVLCIVESAPLGQPHSRFTLLEWLWHCKRRIGSIKVTGAV